MIGTNELKLNQSCINEALQMWVDKYITTKPKVETVERSGNGYQTEWTVKLCERQDEPA
jgi:hypothetical protein